MEMKIATHNSATGEKPKNFLSYLVLPFSKTQSKTIKEQYLAGCRMFDIRVRYYNGILYCAHGLFLTKRRAGSILEEINSFEERCYVCLTYEGKLAKETLPTFERAVENLKYWNSRIKWMEVSVKYTDDDIKVNWKKIYYNKPEFSDEYFTFVDFL